MQQMAESLFVCLFLLLLLFFFYLFNLRMNVTEIDSTCDLILRLKKVVRLYQRKRPYEFNPYIFVLFEFSH
jgi:hypothetical protein